MTHLLASPLLNELLRAFSRMLLHSLWQGLLLSIITGIVILFTGKASAAVRYNIISILLLIFPFVCIYTFTTELFGDHTAATVLVNDGSFHLPGLLHKYGIIKVTETVTSFFANNATLVVTIWFAFFILKCLQVTVGFSYINRIKRTGVYHPGRAWQSTIARLSGQIHLNKTVLLLESGITKIPLVIGHLKPVIYMPIGLLNHLPQDQVEAVLLHELAHIKRNDYLVNIIQQTAQTAFFFNPGFLWVSSILKQEREHCCDDIALRQTHAGKQFIEALVSFTKHSLYGSSYTTAFPGTKNQLVQRVIRITCNRNHSLNGTEKIFFFLSISICILLTGLWGNTKTVKPQRAEAYTIPAKQTAAAPAETIEASTKEALPLPGRKEVIKNEATVKKTAIFSQAALKEDWDNKEEKHEYPAEVMYGKQQQAYARAVTAQEQAAKDFQQAELDRAQADKDRQLAEIDRAQADLNRQQAMKDREQADRDRMQAEHDREQAAVDRKHAESDRQEAIKNRKLQQKKAAAFSPVL